MRVTRAAAEPIGVALVLAAFALLFATPLPLVGTALVAAWLLTRQRQFLRDVLTVADGLDVDQSISRSRVATDETATLSVAIEGASRPTLDVAVRPSLPTASRARGGVPDLQLDGEDVVTRTVEVAWPVAGEFAVDPLTVLARDDRRWFTTSYRTGPTPSVLVEPLRPEVIHIGEGGERLPGAYGDHAAGEFGSGITPADVRQYVSSDPADQIDWKVSARLNDLYVREFEAETDLETALVIDHRAGMAEGGSAGTKLDYLRAVALAYLDHADAHGDPAGLLTIGNEGMTERRLPALGADHRAIVHTRVAHLQPTAADQQERASDDPWVGPGENRTIGEHLTGQAPFDRALRPFFRTAHGYVARIADRPLFGGIREYVQSLPENRLVVVLTDDEPRAELREAVRIARGDRGRVVVFLAPSCLFAADGVTDAAETYRQYVGFEEFRRELDGLDRVSAYEVAPGDRVAAVLDASGERRAPA